MKKKWLEIIFGILFAVTLGWIAYQAVFMPGPWHKWTGFNDKTLWDVLELLVVPFILAITAFFFTRSERNADRKATEAIKKSDHDASKERVREEALQSYLDHMTDLLCLHGLAEPTPSTQVQAIARARTLTILDQMDQMRKANVFRFLYEAGMINHTKVIVPIHDANFARMILYRVNADGCNLSGANLREAIFTFVDIENSKLIGTDLTNASFSITGMKNANLENAKAIGTIFTSVDLRNANLKGTVFRGTNPKATSWEEYEKLPKVEAQFSVINLNGAKYDSRTVWPKGFDPQEHGAIFEDDNPEDDT